MNTVLVPPRHHHRRRTRLPSDEKRLVAESRALIERITARAWQLLQQLFRSDSARP